MLQLTSDGKQEGTAQPPLQVTAGASGLVVAKSTAQRQAERRKRLEASGLVTITLVVPRSVRAEWQVAARVTVERYQVGKRCLVPRLADVRTGTLEKGVCL